MNDSSNFRAYQFFFYRQSVYFVVRRVCVRVFRIWGMQGDGLFAFCRRDLLSSFVDKDGNVSPTKALAGNGSDFFKVSVMLINFFTIRNLKRNVHRNIMPRKITQRECLTKISTALLRFDIRRVKRDLTELKSEHSLVFVNFLPVS